MMTSTFRPAPLSGGNSLTVTSGPERAPLSAKSGFYENRRRNWRVTFATADYLVGPQLIDSAERPLCARGGRSGNSRRVFIPCRRSTFEVTSKCVCSRSGINNIPPAQELQDRRNQATVIVEHDYESRLFSVRRFACGQRFRRRGGGWGPALLGR